jgi:pimeloyl-ACP methyl ester carboxylesterase
MAMRAIEPLASGYAERDAVKVHWEEFGDGQPTIALLPTWSIIHSRFWKAQVPYLARHFRVVTFDGRGTGQSDRPAEPAAYSHLEFAADTIAVLDATETPDAVLVGLSCGALWGVQVAADHPDRVRGLILLAPQVPLAPTHADRTVHPFSERLDTTEGWAKYNRYHWLEGGYRDFVEFFARQGHTEPHSTKQIEDFIEWALDVEPAQLVASDEGLDACGLESFRIVCQRVRAPVLVIHGDSDELAHHARGAALAEVAGGELVTVAGGGHFLQARDPVLVNRLIKRFVERVGR